MKRPELALAVVIMLTFLVAIGSTLASAGTEAARRSDSARNHCQTSVARFLKSPTTTTFDAIPKTTGGGCLPDLTIEQQQKLDSLVSQGNVAAARLLAPQVRRLDGGELEDALRSLGHFSSLHMRDFVALMDTGGLTVREMTDAVTMLPLDMEDNFDAQTAELRRRRTALENQRGSLTTKSAQAAIASLDAFIAEVDRARSAMEAQKHK